MSWRDATAVENASRAAAGRLRLREVIGAWFGNFVGSAPNLDKVCDKGNDKDFCAGLFLTPEETKPPAEIISLRSHLKIHELTGDNTPLRPHAGLAEAVLDPYVNAIHVSLLREKQFNPVYAEQLAGLGAGGEEVQALGEKLLAAGPDQLTAAERMRVMADQRVMVWLHQQMWQRPGESLASWWRGAILEFSRRD